MTRHTELLTAQVEREEARKAEREALLVQLPPMPDIVRRYISLERLRELVEETKKA